MSTVRRRHFNFRDALAREMRLERGAGALKLLTAGATSSSGDVTATEGSSLSSSTDAVLKRLISPAKAKWMVEQGTGLVTPYHAAITSAEHWKDAIAVCTKMIKLRVRPDPETFELIAARVAHDRRFSPEDELTVQRALAEDQKRPVGGSGDPSQDEIFTVAEDSEEYCAFVNAVVPRPAGGTLLQGSEQYRDVPLAFDILRTHERTGCKPKPMTLEHLSSLRIGWHMALHLISYSTNTLRISPTLPVYHRAMELCLHQSRGKASDVFWRRALAVYSDLSRRGLETGPLTYQLAATAVAEGCADPATQWNAALSLCRAVSKQISADEHFVKGETGSELLASLLRLTSQCDPSTAWLLSLQLLLQGDVGRVPSHHMLIPTLDGLIYTMTAMLRGGQYTAAAAVQDLVQKSNYRFRDGSVEALRHFFQTPVLKNDLNAFRQHIRLTLPVIAELLIEPTPQQPKNTEEGAPTVDGAEKGMQQQGVGAEKARSFRNWNWKGSEWEREQRQVKSWNTTLMDSPTAVLPPRLTGAIAQRLAAYTSGAAVCPDAVWVLALRCFTNLHRDQEQFPALAVGRALSRWPKPAAKFHAFLRDNYPEKIYRNGWFFMAKVAHNRGDWVLGLQAAFEFQHSLPQQDRLYDLELVQKAAVMSYLRKGQSQWQRAIDLVQGANPAAAPVLYTTLLQGLLRLPTRERRRVWREALQCAALSDPTALSTLPSVMGTLHLLLADSPLGQGKTDWLIQHFDAVRRNAIHHSTTNASAKPSSRYSGTIGAADFAALW